MTIMIRAEVGSRAYGTHNEFSDKDMAEVIVEPPEYVTGLSSWDTRMTHTAEDGARSTKDDVDTTIYGLKKFASLSAAGNPSVLSILFLGDSSYEQVSESGALLIKYRDLFLSKSAVKRHLGYMMSQRDAMTGARNKRTNRPELVHQFGYDTKFAYHMVRLGILGYELSTTGTLTLPMDPVNVELLMDIRNGKLSKDEVLNHSYELERLIEEALETTDLPEKADTEAISGLLHSIYMSEWSNE